MKIRASIYPETGRWFLSICCVGAFGVALGMASTGMAETETPTDPAPVRSTSMRDVTLSRFSFDEHTPEKKISYSPVSTAAVDPGLPHDAVLMSPMTIRDNRLNYNQLGVDIRKTRPTKATSVTKFGTGVREKDFGKVRAFAVTVLYVPILVGFSW